MPDVRFSARCDNRCGFGVSDCRVAQPGANRLEGLCRVITLFAGIGVGIATWHVRLQNMPADEVPSCGPGFEYIMDNFALFDALGMIFKGSGECAEVVWSLLGLSMPSWVIIGLGGLGIVGIWNNLRKA